MDLPIAVTNCKLLLLMHWNQEQRIMHKIPNWIIRQKQKFLASKYSARTKTAIENVAKGTKSEAIETKVMADTFFKLLSAKLNLDERTSPPTEEEVKAAIEQLKDVGRISVFATISILPGGGFSLIGLELLARRFGIRSFTFVPSAFRKEEGLKKD